VPSRHALPVQPRPRADTVDTAFDEANVPNQIISLVQLELDTQGAGIDDEDRIHCHAVIIAPIRRRASA
jgi:hypothetical protein